MTRPPKYIFGGYAPDMVQMIVLGLLAAYGVFSFIFFGIKAKESRVAKGFFWGTLLGMGLTALMMFGVVSVIKFMV